ncbi:hypothetical protein ACQEU3_24020 [Spirillospora sp. CA-253888]
MARGRRRLRDAGEGALGYLGVILLVSVVAVAVTVVAMPEKVSAGLDNAVCVVTGRGCDPDQPAASGTPSNGTPSSGSPSGAPSSGAPGQNGPPGSPVAEDPEVTTAQTAYDQAMRAAQSVEDEWANFSLLEELKKLGMDFLFGDIKKCIDKPSFGDCLWALVSVVPWGKIGKLLKTIPKLIKLGDRFLDLKSRLDKARKLRDDAKRKLDDALKKKNDKKPPPAACPLPAAQPNGLRSVPLTAHRRTTLSGSAPVAFRQAKPRCEIMPGPIPAAEAIDRGSLVKIREKQLEAALKSLDEDPHGFKADWVGKPNVSRFDAMRDADGRIVLVSKDGKILVPTNYKYIPQ